MKQRKWKRLLALGLSLVMAGTLAACQSGDGGESSQGNGTSQKDEQTADNGLEPITLTFGVVNCEYGNGVHTEKNAFLQKLKEATGVELEYIVMDNDSYNAMAAAGDLPDILQINSDGGAGMTGRMITAGYLRPLDELLDEYGPHIKANIPEALESVKREGGGQIYGLPTHVSYASDVPEKNGWIGFRARYDIYKAIGSPEIVTEDDFLQVLKQMMEYERERTGENDIYGLSAWGDAGLFPYSLPYPFNQGQMNNACGLFDRETGNRVSYLEADSAIWGGIEFYNKAYRMGIFDVDGITQKQAQHNDKVATGKVLATPLTGDIETTVCGEEAIMTFLPGTAFPYLCGTYNIAYPTGYGMESARAISTNCKYPERAMQMFDWIDSPEGARALRNGVQGEDWDYIDGVPQLIGPMKEAYENGTQKEYRKDRTGDVISGIMLFSGDYTTPDGYSTDLTNTEEFKAAYATPAEKAFAQDFDPNFSYPGQVYDMWIKDGKVKDVKTMDGMLRTAYVGGLSDEAMEIYAKLDAYLNSNISKLVLAESEEAFQQEKAKAMEHIYELGYDKVVEEMVQAFEESYRIYEEVYGK